MPYFAHKFLVYGKDMMLQVSYDGRTEDLCRD